MATTDAQKRASAKWNKATWRNTQHLRRMRSGEGKQYQLFFWNMFANVFLKMNSVDSSP